MSGQPIEDGYIPEWVRVGCILKLFRIIPVKGMQSLHDYHDYFVRALLSWNAIQTQLLLQYLNKNVTKTMN